MKEKKHITILLLIIILMASFYSCRINKNSTNLTNKDDEYYSVNFDESNFNSTEILLGDAFEKRFEID